MAKPHTPGTNRRALPCWIFDIMCWLQGKKSGAGSASSAKDTAAREAALAKREQEVKRREAALASRGAAGIDPMMVKNFPSCCPVVHHDIVNDIPEYNKAIMRACAPLCLPHTPSLGMLCSCYAMLRRQFSMAAFVPQCFQCFLPSATYTCHPDVGISPLQCYMLPFECTLLDSVVAQSLR